MESSGKYTCGGYAAGIIAGITYGLNPLFAKSLLQDGVTVYGMLLWRYILGAIAMALYIRLVGKTLRITSRHVLLLVVLGLMFAGSSTLLFCSYRMIAAGLATTIVYLYPVFTALILVFMGRYPSWQVWLSIVVTLVGVMCMCEPTNGENTHFFLGMVLAALSALSYAGYIVVVNHSRRILELSPETLTFYSILFGTMLFIAIVVGKGIDPMTGMKSVKSVANMVGLAIIPTTISMLAVAISTRNIGSTRTAILGVFEPITAIMVCVAAFSEPLTWRIVIGVAVCFAGVTFMIRRSTPSSKS